MQVQKAQDERERERKLLRRKLLEKILDRENERRQARRVALLAVSCAAPIRHDSFGNSSLLPL